MDLRIEVKKNVFEEIDEKVEEFKKEREKRIFEDPLLRPFAESLPSEVREFLEKVYVVFYVGGNLTDSNIKGIFPHTSTTEEIISHYNGHFSKNYQIEERPALVWWSEKDSCIIDSSCCRVVLLMGKHPITGCVNLERYEEEFFRSFMSTLTEEERRIIISQAKKKIL